MLCADKITDDRHDTSCGMKAPARTATVSDKPSPTLLAQTLLRDGWMIIPQHVEASQIRAIEAELAPRFADTPFSDGDFYGRRTKRFGSLLARSRSVADLVLDPLILSLASAVLRPWCDRLQLNLTQAIEIYPAELMQSPHRDQDMWQGVKGEVEYLVNVMWPLTRFTTENGATLLYPGSHGRQALDPAPPSTPITALCEPGSAIVFLGSTLHGAGTNRSAASRRAILVSYCLGWLKPYENQWLAYPPAIARHFPTELAGLVGYAQHRPNLGNVEGRCPSELLESGNARAGAIDALRPDQADAVAAHRAAQLRG